MSTQNQREITIYATRGGKTEKITTDVTTWGALRPLVQRAGYDLSSLLAAESFTKHDLVNDLALLPVENFRLFLRPRQTKSGAEELSRKECFGMIKNHVASNPKNKQKFIIDGKNMTQLSTPVLQKLVSKYCKGTTSTTPVKEVAKKVGKVVESVIKSKTARKVSPLVAIIASLKTLPYSGYIDEAIDTLEYELNATADENGMMAPETEEDILAREARDMGY